MTSGPPRLAPNQRASRFRSLRRWASSLSLLVVAVALSLLLGEGLSRLVLNRVDYLVADPVFDSVLAVRLDPHVAGHDAWGFRNRAVPDSADIVTIGDSQTYGISAPAHLSWPAQLGKLTNRRVYNLALGGYGPVQYHELLRTRALRLHPKIVVVGLYYGNDLWDAYAAVYGLRHWSALRQAGIPLVADSAPAPQERAAFLGPIRDWLARHSVVYRVASFTALGGVARGLEFSTQNHAGDVVPFRHPLSGAQTGFTPAVRLKALDLRDQRVREGLRLSLDQLQRIEEECRGAGIHLLVVLIPTKERVFAPWLARRNDLQELETFRALFENEARANRQIRERLDQIGLRYVDLEQPLQDAAAARAIYPANDDGHPNSEGYAVIARAVASAMRDWLP